MAQYKVPQDVEADDKLIGPFSFRQFVYLLIAAGCIAVGVALFKLFPLLIIIPLLPAILLIVLALPLKKDQPMETYLAAIVSFYLKPRKRMWMPGQRETTIEITAPKIVEDVRTRDITGEEATHRLSFLADIVDTGGYAIKGAASNNMREELLAEVNETPDMFEAAQFDNLSDAIARGENERHEEVINKMQQAIHNGRDIEKAQDENRRHAEVIDKMQQAIHESEDILTEPNEGEAKVGLSERPNVSSGRVVEPEFDSPVVVRPSDETVEKSVEKPKSAQKSFETSPKPSIIELANNPDFSVATIAKEADRINRKEKGEVFISLH